ncbi:MAG TPA: bifunctional enoyl-CoA hydratase/phosphate acetyltransferase [Candidatus Kapabacteria bacterium]|nr:bifunctional enoyl-CoA hydratase/phosphate acetyltransferase [Candidatus Kapabacteria bacterium]
MEIKKLDTFIELAKSKGKKNIAVAAAEDDAVLSAIQAAVHQDLVNPILIGDKSKILEIAKLINFDVSNYNIIDESIPSKSSILAVKEVREGRADILMKGLVSTADFLRAILNKESGLRSGDLLSHIGFFELESYHKLIALTDAAQNIAPDFNEKISILKNSIKCLHTLGIDTPKIAVIAAIEGVNSKMQTTIEAAAITMMNKRHQIKGCIIDGPLAFDNAISKEAAEHKSIQSEVAGDADLIFAPNIEVANALYKSFTYFAKATVAAVILGATVPIVLTSRADSDRSKLMSIALAASH